jgi:toxin-antitoxin system PIN domain toxin
MKLLADVNILLALAAEGHAHHQAVRRWWSALPSTTSLQICREVQLGFLRLLCHAAVMGREAVTLPQAWELYAGLIDSGRFAFVFEPAGLESHWLALCQPFRRSPAVVADAYLAAFARAGGFQLATLDKGFKSFPGVSLLFPVDI